MLRDPDERQRLLETLDPADRLEQMIDLAASLLQRYGPGDLTVN
jgi:hypothetical protein